MLRIKRGEVKEKVCVDKCNNLSIRDYMVSVLRPVDYQDEGYRDFLKALSIATDGAFQFTDPGGQAIPVISPLRTAEKIFSKNGRVIDRHCLSFVKKQIACLAFDDLSLKPVLSEQDGLLGFDKKNSKYELSMKFEQTDKHQEAVHKLAQVLIIMAEQAGRKIHQDDMALLEKSNEAMSLNIGSIDFSDIDNFMKQDIDDAIADSQINPLEIITETYGYRVEKNKSAEQALLTFSDQAPAIGFDPLTIDITKRNSKRSKNVSCR